MSIAIYYLSLFEPHVELFESTQLSQALTRTQELRNDGFKHVTMSCVFEESVGLPGVSSVDNGKTPDGVEYDWSKKQRGDGPQKVIT